MRANASPRADSSSVCVSIASVPLEDLDAAEAVIADRSLDLSRYAIEQLTALAPHLGITDWLRLLAMARSSAVIATSLAQVAELGAPR